MLYPRYHAPLHIRMYRDLCWYIRSFISAIPDMLAGLCLAALFALLPILAAFVL